MGIAKPNYVVCHYGEIGLKGGNRRFFEERLVKNIKQALDKCAPGSFEFVKRISGRIIIKLRGGMDPRFRGDDTSVVRDDIIEKLKDIFGIAYFAFTISSKQEIGILEKDALNLLQNESGTTFRVSTQRSKKDFPLTSPEINEKVGAFICQKLKKKVDLEEPQTTCFIEIVDNFAFLYTEKIKGAGGLPVGVSGRAMVLLSGGIDSPVAAFYVLKRGVEAVFIHFHAYPYTDKASVEKVAEIVNLLNRFQLKAKLYLIPFADVQKEILVKTPAALRVILYRRFMFRIAEVIAEREGIFTLVTGESIGQVASQTLENIKVIEDAVELSVLRPLIGLDKEEIIAQAQEIGTYEISIQPHQDCCSRFLPKHPATKARLADVKAAEKKLNIEALVQKAVGNAGIKLTGDKWTC